MLLSIHSKVISKTSVQIMLSQSTGHDEFLVYIMPSTTIIPAGKLINIQCKINLGNINNRIPMLFETEETELPEGLETADTVVSVKSGINDRLKIPVVNSSKHDIFLPKNTIIGRLQQISHITPLQVKERKADTSTVQSSLNKDGRKWEKSKKTRTGQQLRLKNLNRKFWIALTFLD